MQTNSRIHVHRKELAIHVYRFGSSSGSACELELCQEGNCTSIDLYFDSFEESKIALDTISSAISQSIPLNPLDGELLKVVRYINRKEEEKT